MPDKTDTAQAPFWKTLLTGFLIGIGAIAPGVSGGAFAVIFGLYAAITDAVAHIYHDFRKKLRFLLPLGIGGVLGVLLFGRLVEWLFTYYEVPVRWLFVGLMVGTLPSVFREAGREGFRKRYLLPMLVCGAGIFLLSKQQGVAYTGDATALPMGMSLLCGAVVGFGTIVPGASASFVLMSMGLYEPMLRALNALDFSLLLPMGIGFLAFVVLFAKLVSWLYSRAYGWISYAVTGLLIGSILAVVPSVRADRQTVLALLLAVIGGLLSFTMLQIKGREQG